MKSILLSVFIALSLLLVLCHITDAAVSCPAVTGKAAACVGFATGNAKTPSPACCAGLQQLAAMVKTVPDKQQACKCLRTSGQSLHILDKYLTQLPSLCKINVGFPISTSTNCAAIH